MTNRTESLSAEQAAWGDRRPMAVGLAMLLVGLLPLSAQADLVGQYISTAGITADGGNITLWADQVGGYDMTANATPTLVSAATPNGMAAVQLDGAEDDYFAGETAAPTGFPLADATSLTVATMFQPGTDIFDNDAGNENFWGHPTIISGDQGGAATDWGFSWGPGPANEGADSVWFGVGNDTGDGTPTATVPGAENDGSWYISVGTWDGSAGTIDLYLYGENGVLLGDASMEVPSTMPRVDVGGSIGGERPNPALRSYNGQLATVDLYDNAVDAEGAETLALDIFDNFVGGTPVVPLQLEVNTTSGEVTLQNPNVQQDFTIDYYEVTSEGAGSLDASGWDSLEDQNFDVDDALIGDYDGNGVVGAGDYVVWRNTEASGGTLINEGATPGVADQADYEAWVQAYGDSGGGNGLGWTESGGSDANILSELYLGAAGSTIEAGESISLGQAFSTGAAQDLQFSYALLGGGLSGGDVVYVSGGSSAAIPEPASALLGMAALLAVGVVGRRQKFEKVSHDGR